MKSILLSILADRLAARKEMRILSLMSLLIMVIFQKRYQF